MMKANKLKNEIDSPDNSSDLACIWLFVDMPILSDKLVNDSIKVFES